MDEKLVKKTWKGCLENEDELPEDWHRLKGVLVGILRRPRGRHPGGTASWTQGAPHRVAEATSA